MNFSKYLHNPIYYSFLLTKKIKQRIHNLFELRHSVTNSITIEELQIHLWKNFLNHLNSNAEGYYYKTRVTRKNKPVILSQARIILVLCNDFEKGEPKFRSKFLIKKLTDFLISMRDENNLFKFNIEGWNLQDEGIASVWATLALLSAYETLGENKYLNEAELTLEAMLENLYTKETSLKHTQGDDFWTLDAASTFALVCCLFLKYKYSKKIENAMIESINLCINEIDDDGHFHYNKLRKKIYLLLYHPIVMFTLESCLQSKYIDDVTSKKLIETLTLAKKFLISCIDEDGRIFEPEMTRFSQYIISNITTLVALKGKINRELEQTLQNNITKFWTHNKLYLCIDEKENAYNGDLYKLRDVYLIEVLYWIDIYLNHTN